MVHQHFMLVPNMTVAENVALGGTGRYDVRQVAQQVRDVGARHGLAIEPEAEVGTLPVSAQQRVEILKALVRNAGTLILDEPTAVLAPDEARALLSAMRDFVGRGGSVVLITHKLRDALEFADDITVLRRGRTVYTSRSSASNETELASAMLGTPLIDPEPKAVPERALLRAEEASSNTPVFVLHDVAVTGARGVAKLEHVSLAVHAGEIVGVAAVEGNGQHELLRVLANRQAANAGTVDVPPVVGFVPEDRHRDAVALGFTLYENVALAGAGARRGTIAWNAERAKTEQLMHEYDVRAPAASTMARTLSGGNQQKLVVGREMSAAPKALVVENPTRGLDVQATADVHERLRAARAQGTAIVVYSSDLDEVLALADRIVVLYGKRLSEVPHDRDAVGSVMVGRSGER
jgi:simple sugar transport system ATP-binding protein